MPNLITSFPSRGTEAQRSKESFSHSSPWCFIERFYRNHTATQSYLYGGGQGHVGNLDGTKDKTEQNLEEWVIGGDQELLPRKSWEGIW